MNVTKITTLEQLRKKIHTRQNKWKEIEKRIGNLIAWARAVKKKISDLQLEANNYQSAGLIGNLNIAEKLNADAIGIHNDKKTNSIEYGSLVVRVNDKWHRVRVKEDTSEYYLGEELK